MDENLQRCIDLLKENEDRVRDSAELTLLTLCQNILSYPEERKNREVRLDDPVVVEKLLPAVGAMECLFDVGFVEAADHLFLPHSASLSRLQALQKLLSKVRPSKSHSNKNYHKHMLPANTLLEEEKFLSKIVEMFESVLRFEDIILQERARRLIPIVQFENAVAKRIRELQKHIKLSETNAEKSVDKQFTENDINAKDLLLAELLYWFKHKFFTWIDSPKCSVCFGDCTYEKVVASADPKCSRIELHRCTKCEALIKFPRYSDPEPLLNTRCGRCGEWAKVFTLFCRSLGYDSRLVLDETDHVWTEVWSDSEKRWIHVDPCENEIDKPLMYERGWGKKLSYIIAFSKDEVQDVTWRYTRDHIAVLKRRLKCSESKLLQFIERLNTQRQSSTNYSSTRRQYVIKRRLLELAELIRMPNESSIDDGKSYHGRSTGSYAWKLARGEVSQEAVPNNYSWNISRYGRNFELHYSIVKDTYKVIGENNTVLTEMVNWQKGVHEIEGEIFRKVEHDWKMVYLARSPGSSYSKIKWSFEVSDLNLYVMTFDLRALATVFHNANVSWELEAFFDREDNPCKTLVLSIADYKNYRTDEVQGARKLILTATVSGGQGDIAWQHAQLFRQSLDSTEQSMIVKILLNER